MAQTRSCARFRRPRQKSGAKGQTIARTISPDPARARWTKGAQRSIPKVPSSPTLPTRPTRPTLPTLPTIPAHPMSQVQVQVQGQVQGQVRVPVLIRIREYLIRAVQEVVRILANTRKTGVTRFPKVRDITGKTPIRTRTHRTGPGKITRPVGPSQNRPTQNIPTQNRPTQNRPPKCTPTQRTTVQRITVQGSPIQRPPAPKDPGPKDHGPKDHGPKNHGPKDHGPKDHGPKPRGPRHRPGPGMKRRALRRSSFSLDLRC